jgi:hypothetical protein
MTEIFFPDSMDAFTRGQFIRARLPVLPSQLPSVSCGWTRKGTWYFEFSTPRPRYVLKYREAGKRAGSERWAKRDVDSVREAVAWMNENQDKAFLPAFVLTRAWSPETVAILGPL